ncbi:MAG: glycosyltransferase family 39 protein [Bacteroidota bacterium]|nr:glycosyltransferase family 39 protein [Candidatus Kapabacteria bacterium]MDW8219126.1 glycosyltransferase family 39 protein [Bacteroidota bacterium]
MQWTQRDTMFALCTACFAASLVIPLLSLAHLLDPFETFCAEVSRELLVTGKYTVMQYDFEPLWSIPPLFHWIQAVSMQACGVTEYAARLPNAVLNALAMPIVFVIGKYLHNERFGILWTLLYAASFVSIALALSAVSYPLGNLCTLLALCCLSLYYAPRTGSPRALGWIIAAGVFAGCAVLSVGFPILLLVVCTWCGYWMTQRTTVSFPFGEGAVFLAVVLLVSSLWFGAELLTTGLPFFREFLLAQVPTLSPTPSLSDILLRYTMLAGMLLACFPVSAFVTLLSAKHLADTYALYHCRVWLSIFLAVVMLFGGVFPLQVLDYSVLVYPLSFVSAYTLLGIVGRGHHLKRYTVFIFVSIGGLWSVLLIGLPLIATHPNWLSDSFSPTLFREQTHVPVEWSLWDWCIGAVFMLGLIGILALMLTRRHLEWILLMSIICTAIFYVACVQFLPKLEAHLQHQVLTFYKRAGAEHAYLVTLGFESPAALFYSKKSPANAASAHNLTREDFTAWLLEGTLDKPAYYVCKISNAKHWRNHPNLTEVTAGSEFVLFKREPTQPSSTTSLPRRD